MIPANIYVFKVNNGNTGKRCEICSKLIIKTTERRPGISYNCLASQLGSLDFCETAYLNYLFQFRKRNGQFSNYSSSKSSRSIFM